MDSSTDGRIPPMASLDRGRVYIARCEFRAMAQARAHLAGAASRDNQVLQRGFEAARDNYAAGYGDVTPAACRRAHLPPPGRW